MTTHIDETRFTRSESFLRNWPSWAALFAAAWSAGYAILALSRIGHASSGGLYGLGAGTVAALALASALLALRLDAHTRRAHTGLAYGALAWTVAATLLLGVPDARIVAVIAYIPMFVLGAPFGWPPVSISDVLPWPVLNQIVTIPGGVAWSMAALVHTRRARGVCEACGRGARRSIWTTRAFVVRWGTAATIIAAVIPLFYAATRFAWAAGIPLGITDSFLREGQKIGMWKAGAALASVAVVGAWLTVGLVRPWGRTFPSWIPVLRRRRVPPWVAIAPASLFSFLFLAAGLDGVASFVQHGFPPEGWGTTAPVLLWPVWGLALGAATFAYHLRRRSRCGECGRV